jgi:hypothetical protein
MVTTNKDNLDPAINSIHVMNNAMIVKIATSAATSVLNVNVMSAMNVPLSALNAMNALSSAMNVTINTISNPIANNMLSNSLSVNIITHLHPRNLCNSNNPYNR